MEFIKKGELQLLNGDYLSSASGAPVTNDEFMEVQQKAKYVITLAKLAEGKKFKAESVDSIEQLMQEVEDVMNADSVEFVKTKKQPKQTVTRQLKDEALAFINYSEEVEQNNKVNNYLQQFKVLKDFNDYGLFFYPGVSRLDKIYTLDEVVAAVTKVIDLL